MSSTSQNPDEVLSQNDPGDETQRNFRYQNSYAAILLIGSSNRTFNYIAVWCEHHEDILAEYANLTFDAYQIKTSKPENGYWQLKDEEILKSLKRFIRHYQKFGEKIGIFGFISNTETFDCLPTVEKSRLIKSPHKCVEAARNATTLDDFKSSHFYEFLSKLVKECSCDEQTVFNVLKKTHFRKGPSREDCDAVLSHNHLAHLENCKHMSKAALNAVRDELIQKVYIASSLQVDDPAKYLITVEQKNDPHLLAKRVAVDMLLQLTTISNKIIFRYQPLDLTINLTEHAGKVDILQKKFIKGNLAEQIQTMKRRKLTSESRLFEINASSPNSYQEIITQLESIVQAECDEAKLEATQKVGNGNPFGEEMFINVIDRLKNKTTNQPKSIYDEQYETLVGIVALLTENCSVWWSEKFDLNGAA